MKKIANSGYRGGTKLCAFWARQRGYATFGWGIHWGKRGKFPLQREWCYGGQKLNKQQQVKLRLNRADPPCFGGKWKQDGNLNTYLVIPGPGPGHRKAGDV